MKTGQVKECELNRGQGRNTGSLEIEGVFPKLLVLVKFASDNSLVLMFKPPLPFVISGRAQGTGAVVPCREGCGVF